MYDENGEEYWIQLTPHARQILTKRTYSSKLRWMSLPLDLIDDPFILELTDVQKWLFVVMLSACLRQTDAKVRLSRAIFARVTRRYRAKDVLTCARRAEEYQWVKRVFLQKTAVDSVPTLHNITVQYRDFLNLDRNTEEIRNKLLRISAKKEEEKK